MIQSKFGFALLNEWVNQLKTQNHSEEAWLFPAESETSPLRRDTDCPRAQSNLTDGTLSFSGDRDRLCTRAIGQICHQISNRRPEAPISLPDACLPTSQDVQLLAPEDPKP